MFIKPRNTLSFALSLQHVMCHFKHDGASIINFVFGWSSIAENILLIYGNWSIYILVDSFATLSQHIFSSWDYSDIVGFAVTSWCIWYTRNQAVFQSSAVFINSTASLCKTMFWQQVEHSNSQPLSLPRKPPVQRSPTIPTGTHTVVLDGALRRGLGGYRCRHLWFQ